MRKIFLLMLFVGFCLAHVNCSLLGPKPAHSPYLNYQTKTNLRLPFEGPWVVYWGGASIDQNLHASQQDQRFAYGFVRIPLNEAPQHDVIKQRQTYIGKGRFNRDYYAFDQSVLAPGPGKVINIVDGVEDHRPRLRGHGLKLENPFGNSIVIDHENGEYSFLAHLKQGSIVVSVGQYVSPGQLLGKCGNSGQSSEPHLHYHLQNSPEVRQGQGLPAYFQNYSTGGQRIEQGMPQRGEVVNP
jgi:murein DD-endopeptidase MepM/ murein hydrolase activator NlpD